MELTNLYKNFAEAVYCDDHSDNMYDQIMNLIAENPHCVNDVYEGNTALHIGIQRDDHDLVTFLVEKPETDLLAKNSEGKTADELAYEKDVRGEEYARNTERYILTKIEERAGARIPILAAKETMIARRLKAGRKINFF